MRQPSPPCSGHTPPTACVPVWVQVGAQDSATASAIQTVSDLCIAVNPHHAAFYRKAFHFQDIVGVKQYGKVNGAPAIALRLDLALARSLMRELRDGHPMISEVHEFLFHPAHVEAVMTRLVKDVRRVIPLEERVEHFFSRHEAWTEASEADRAYIRAGCDS